MCSCFSEFALNELCCVRFFMKYLTESCGLKKRYLPVQNNTMHRNLNTNTHARARTHTRTHARARALALSSHFSTAPALPRSAGTWPRGEGGAEGWGMGCRVRGEGCG